MVFQVGLFTFLTSQSALTDLIATRIYSRLMPQKPTLPLLVYNKISNPRVYSQDGDSGLENPRYQFDVWADDPDSAEQIADILIGILSGYKGAMGDETVGASFVENDEDGYDAETGLYRVMVEVVFWKES